MKNYFVTTSIPYVNGEPHIGHAQELVEADVFARYARKQGMNVIFSTGTDEHGGKIAEKAAEYNTTPKKWADEMSLKFKNLTEILNVSADRFIRTTDHHHEQTAQKIWQLLSADIYKSSYVGWYCTGDEAFFTETEVKYLNGICPNHDRPFEKIEEENYFFKLSKYSSAIKQAILSKEFHIIPESKSHEILSLIDEGLEDVSVSRPKEKITWGIPVPGDDNQLMYVWFEALMNYITVIGFPDHQDFKDFWPADIQVIGKDIIRFHAAIWPAMLLSLGLPLPKKLFVHGFITLEGKKISKSLGNVIAPAEIINKYGVDAFRYYFLRHIPSYSDGDFNWESFNNAYNNELANELGNAVQRTVVLIDKYFEKEKLVFSPAQHDSIEIDQSINQCRLDRAIDLIWEQVRGLNQYIDESKPWEVAKTGDTEHLKEVLTYQVANLLEIAILLQPFLPDTSSKIIKIFGDNVENKYRTILFPKIDK